MANSETFELYKHLISLYQLQLTSAVAQRATELKSFCGAEMMWSYKANYKGESSLSHSNSLLRYRMNLFRFLSTKIREKKQTWSTILCLIMVLRSRTFIATLSPVSVFWANFTFAKVPSPIVLPTSYLPTFLTTISAVNLLRSGSKNPNLQNSISAFALRLLQKLSANQTWIA